MLSLCDADSFKIQARSFVMVFEIVVATPTRRLQEIMKYIKYHQNHTSHIYIDFIPSVS